MSVLEIALAVFVPVAISITVSRLGRFDDALRRVALVWFTPLVLVWYAPFWLTGSTNAPLDFLFFQIGPWNNVAPTVSYTGLLSDSVLQFLPWREVVVDAYRHFEMPFLNRYSGSGSPLWPNPQAQVLSPILLAGIPFSTFAWPVFASVCKTLIALWGMFLFLRKLMLSPRAATVGAIAWAFCAYNFAFSLFPHTEVSGLLPWLMLAIHEANIAGCAIAVALMVFGGHPESLLHAAFLAVPYGIREMVVRRDRTILLRLAAGALIGALLAAPVLIPFLMFLPLGERTAFYETHSAIMTAPAVTAANVAAAIFPAALWSTRATAPRDNFNEVAGSYAGAAAIALAVAAMLTRFRENRFWILSAAIFYVLSFSSPTHDAVLGRIPVIGLAAHGRLRFVVAFIVAVLAARMIDAVPSRRALAIVVAAMAVAIVALAAAAPALDRGIVAASAAAALLSLATLVFAPRWLPFLLFADLAILGAGYHAPNSSEHFYPRTPALDFLRSRPGPFRIAGLGNTLMPNTSAMAGLENVGVHDPMSVERYGDALAEAGYDRGGYFGGFRGEIRRDRLAEMNVRYIVGPPGKAASGLPVVYSGADATIYEELAAKPRYPGRVVAYGRNGVVLDLWGDREEKVMAREVSIPGWQLTRDGEAHPVRDLGPVAIGWTAPPGRARYELFYRPPGFFAGIFCAGIGLLAVGYLLLNARNSSVVAPR